jgi:SAM-dependent methyltransferase
MKLFCALCEQEKEVKPMSDYKHRSSLFENKKLFECGECGLIFIHPMPTPDELDWYYKNVWIKDGKTVSTSHESELIYQIQADERLKYLSRHIGLADIKKVLDIGSGFGYLCDSFKKNGLKEGAFYATDPSPDNLARLKSEGISAFSSLDEVKEHDFDLITLCCVLEHVNDPVKFIALAREHLKPGGYMLIDVPERDDTFKPVLEPHVAVYTVESLKNLAKKLGLEVVHITGYGTRRSELIARANPNKGILGRARSLAGRLAAKLARGKSARENLYKEYKFDEEGRDRWWIRAILRKK